MTIVALITAASEAIGRAALERPGLSTALAQLESCHAAHLATLAVALPSDQPATPVPGAPSGALGQEFSDYQVLMEREDALASELVAQANGAESGDLARLFASAAAGLAQSMTALPRTASR